MTTEPVDNSVDNYPLTGSRPVPDRFLNGQIDPPDESPGRVVPVPAPPTGREPLATSSPTGSRSGSRAVKVKVAR